MYNNQFNLMLKSHLIIVYILPKYLNKQEFDENADIRGNIPISFCSFKTRRNID